MGTSFFSLPHLNAFSLRQTESTLPRSIEMDCFTQDVHVGYTPSMLKTSFSEEKSIRPAVLLFVVQLFMHHPSRWRQLA